MPLWEASARLVWGGLFTPDPMVWVRGRWVQPGRGAGGAISPSLLLVGIQWIHPQFAFGLYNRQVQEGTNSSAGGLLLTWLLLSQ